MKYSILILVISFSFIACDNNEEALNKLNERNKTITALAVERTEELRESEAVIANMNARINLVLNELEEGEVPDEFQEKVLVLQQRLKNSSTDLSQLQANLKRTSGEQKKLVGSLQQLESDLLHQEQEMTAVLLELQEADIVIADQEETLVSLQIENGQLRQEMNQAYVAIGSMKQLKEQGVVKKVGGLFGLGGKAVLSADMNESAFSQIDGSLATSLTLNGQNATLVSNHPEGSYELVEFEEQSSLQIKDPEEFWSRGKYLTIALN
ncbi:MAG: hypothetical protein ACPGWM_07920 [Flavobacteriales bacterium]